MPTALLEKPITSAPSVGVSNDVLVPEVPSAVPAPNDVAPENTEIAAPEKVAVVQTGKDGRLVDGLARLYPNNRFGRRIH